MLTLEQAVVTEKLTNILPIPKVFDTFTPSKDNTSYPQNAPRLIIDANAFSMKEAKYETPAPVIKTEQTAKYIKSLSDKDLIDLCVGPGYSGLGYNVTPTPRGSNQYQSFEEGNPQYQFLRWTCRTKPLPEECLHKIRYSQLH